MPETLGLVATCEFISLQQTFLRTSSCWALDDFPKRICCAKTSCVRILGAFRVDISTAQTESEIEARLLCKGPGTKLTPSGGCASRLWLHVNGVTTVPNYVCKLYGHKTYDLTYVKNERGQAVSLRF